jgi:flagellar biosynthesis protein FlhF
MRIRRYQAATTREAFNLIRADLGPEAVVISSRRVRGGVEVSAAIDYDAPVAASPPPRTADAPAPAASKGSAPQVSALKASAPVDAALRDIRLDLAALRQIVLESSLLREEGPGRAALFGYLTGRGLTSEVALDVIVALGPEATQPGLPLEDAGLEALARVVGGMVSVGGFGVCGGGKRCVAALVGPTGVGKTTMLAKLAARLSLVEKRRVGIISCDSYRIGSPDQIRAYARILELPLALADSERDLSHALAAQADRDVVLIDTAGRSPMDAERLREVAALAEAGVESHLVLSATTRDEQLAAAIRGFSAADYKSVIFTKLDEAERLGAILNAALRARRPISWLGSGQRVPGGLDQAQPEKVARLVLRSI